MCSYLPRHDRSISHGNDGVVANSVLLNEQHICVPGNAADSGRSDIIFSAVLTTGSKHRAEGDLHDAWSWTYGNNGCDSDDCINTALAGYQFDSEVAVVVDAQVATKEGFELFIRGSSAMLCKHAIPKVAILKIRRTMVNTMIWRCGELTKVKDSSLRVVLKEHRTHR